MIYSEKDVIEKIKNLTKTVKNDQTFESVVDRFINETFGDPSGTWDTQGNTEGVESLILDLTNNNEEIRKFFNNDQYNILIEKLNLWQDQYFE